VVFSRGLEAFRKMVLAVLPRLDYQACYFAKVVKFDQGRQQVDLEPDDARLPTLQGVPFRGPPGALWHIDESSKPTVLVTWENGDPSRPVAFGFAAGAHVLKATWTADLLELGAAGGEPPPLGNTYRSAEDTYLDEIVTGVQAALTALSLAPAAATLTAAQVKFKAGSSGYLASKVRVT
jgi:hypothetical protein